VPDSTALEGPRCVFHNPPPAVRLVTPGTPDDAHTHPGRVVRKKGAAMLLDFGHGRWAAADRHHWTGWWSHPAEAVKALERLREMNALRVAQWRKMAAQKKIRAVADTAFPGGMDAINAAAAMFKKATS